jgi:hypothetical protein
MAPTNRFTDEGIAMKNPTKSELARSQATDLLRQVIEHQQISSGALSTGASAAKWCADFIDEMAKRLEAVKSDD